MYKQVSGSLQKPILAAFRATSEQLITPDANFCPPSILNIDDMLKNETFKHVSLLSCSFFW